MPWTVIYIAPSKAQAEHVKGILTRAGILVSLRQSGVPSTRTHIEVMVPEGEAEEAHEILNEALRR